jgi:hypothetical protein
MQAARPVGRVPCAYFDFLDERRICWPNHFEALPHNPIANDKGGVQMFGIAATRQHNALSCHVSGSRRACQSAFMHWSGGCWCVRTSTSSYFSFCKEMYFVILILSPALKLAIWGLYLALSLAMYALSTSHFSAL